MDGKDLRAASKQTGDGRRMMVAAVEHDTGVVLGQVEVDSKSNEMPALPRLSSDLDLTGRVVAMGVVPTTWSAPSKTTRRPTATMPPAPRRRSMRS